MFKIIVLFFIITNLYSIEIIENFNKVIKEDKNIDFKNKYEQFVFENPKELINFFIKNRYYYEFNEVYQKLDINNKKLILEYIIDDTDKYKELLKGSNVYKTIFISSNVEDEQEVQFHIYNLLLDNKKAYYNIIEYSNIEDHYLSIFNPNNLIYLNKRYKYFVLMFFNKNYIVSYPNVIDYILSSPQIIKELEDYGFKDNYDYSIKHYINIDTKLEIPFPIRGILYDRLNKSKVTEIYINIILNTKLNDFIINLKDLNFYSKYSHDFLIKYLKDSNEIRIKNIESESNDNNDNLEEIKVTKNNSKFLIKNEDIIKYFNNIGMNLNHYKLNSDTNIFIKTKDKFNEIEYENLEKFLNENSIEYIY